MDARYGSFLIYVLRRPGSESIYKTEQGRPVKPDPHGVYWHDSGGSWEAMKPYGNVVLSWNAEDRVLGEGFERLDALLSQLGKPAEQVRAAMPASDQPCGAQPAAGTCRGANGATVTTVERDQRLKLATLEVKVVRVETGRVVIPPRDYGLVRRAKGRYVLAAMRIKNTGNEPLRGLYDVRLKIGEKIYDQSSEATWTATPMDAFPVQPDDSSVAALVFDVPVRRRARSDGERRPRVPVRRRPRERRGRPGAGADPAREACGRQEGLARSGGGGAGTPPPPSPILRLAAHAAAAGAGLGGRAARGGDAEHAHRLQAEAELLAAVGGGDVEPGQVLHALEPVADRVAVRVEPGGGAGDVAVGVEERLERLHQVGLVLVVVGHERRDRLA